jgi:hypothetical protein
VFTPKSCLLDPTVRPATNPDSIRLRGKEPEQPYTVLPFDSESLAGSKGGSRLSAKVVVFEPPASAKPLPD